MRVTRVHIEDAAAVVDTRISHLWFSKPPGVSCAVRWHQVIVERNREMDDVIVEILRREPAKLDMVVAWIHKRLADPDYSVQSKAVLADWLQLIRNEGVNGVLEVLMGQSAEAARMRQSSPFGIVMPQEKRLEILRRYRPFSTSS